MLTELNDMYKEVSFLELVTLIGAVGLPLSVFIGMLNGAKSGNKKNKEADPNKVPASEKLLTKYRHIFVPTAMLIAITTGVAITTLAVDFGFDRKTVYADYDKKLDDYIGTLKTEEGTVTSTIKHKNPSYTVVKYQTKDNKTHIVKTYNIYEEFVKGDKIKVANFGGTVHKRVGVLKYPWEQNSYKKGGNIIYHDRGTDKEKGWFY